MLFDKDKHVISGFEVWLVEAREGSMGISSLELRIQVLFLVLRVLEIMDTLAVSDVSAFEINGYFVGSSF